MRAMMRIEIERETDGRWIAEVVELPGVIVYGATRREARKGAAVLAAAVVADRVTPRETIPDSLLP